MCKLSFQAEQRYNPFYEVITTIGQNNDKISAVKSSLADMQKKKHTRLFKLLPGDKD